MKNIIKSICVFIFLFCLTSCYGEAVEGKDVITLDQTNVIFADDELVVMPYTLSTGKDEVFLTFQADKISDNNVRFYLVQLDMNGERVETYDFDDPFVLIDGLNTYSISLGDIKLDDIETIAVQIDVNNGISDTAIQSDYVTIYQK